MTGSGRLDRALPFHVVPPTEERPQLRRLPSLILNASVVTTCSLSAATGLLALIGAAGRAWMWTALAAAAALLVAAGAAVFGQKPPVK